MLLSTINNYPIVKVPSFVLTVKNSFPASEIKEPTKPEKPKLNEIPNPTRPIRAQSSGVAIPAIIFLSIISYILYQMNDEINTPTLLLAICALIGKIYIETTRTESYENNLRDYHISKNTIPELERKAQLQYQKELLIYEKETHNYNINLSSYYKDLEKAKTKDRIAEYQNAKLIKELQNSSVALKHNDAQNINKGVTENQFYEVLKNSIQYRCYQNYKLKFWNSEKGYYPDILIITDLNFYIDLEIDEPYVGANGEPIHYIGIDDSRDNHFIESGWIIVRFTEEQIIKNTLECINFIKELIEHIQTTYDNEDLAKYVISSSNKYKLTSPQWTKDYAHKLAFTRYRNGYLGHKLSEKLSTEIINQPISESSQYILHKKTMQDAIDDLPF